MRENTDKNNSEYGHFLRGVFTGDKNMDSEISKLSAKHIQVAFKKQKI